jgi:hypothetical protein
MLIDTPTWAWAGATATPPSVAATSAMVSVSFFMFAPLESKVLVRLHRTRGRVDDEANSRKKVLKVFRDIPPEFA